jgi:hypothetical protein
MGLVELLLGQFELTRFQRGTGVSLSYAGGGVFGREAGSEVSWHPE